MSEQISQIQFDKIFIKSLLDKLKVGNKRTIHLNAIPGNRKERLDLFQLSCIDVQHSQNTKNTAEKFLYQLLNEKEFSFDINYEKINQSNLDEDQKIQLGQLSQKLNGLVDKQDEFFSEYGLKNFGLGFPLLIKRDTRDPQKFIKAPLFIWNLDIKRSYQAKNTWKIIKKEDDPIRVNELLLSNLSQNESIYLSQLSDDILEDGVLDKKELSKLCKNILSQLNVDDIRVHVKIEKCLSKDIIESITASQPWIQWSGVFGIYSSQKEAIIADTEALLKQSDEFNAQKLTLDQFQTSTIASVETDPSKEEILNTLTKNEIKLIQGPPGTGKSQSITAIVSNALANNTRCLIVCEKKTALDVIYNNLEKIGLSDYTAVINDVHKDRKHVVKKARETYDNLPQKNHHSFTQQSYQTQYEKYTNFKKDLNKKYSEALSKVFGEYSWKDLIGLYLKYSKSSKFHYICESLQNNILKFTYEEYTQFLSTIEEASYLYQDISHNSHEVFNALDDQIFEREFSLQSFERVNNNVNNLLKYIELLKDFLSDNYHEGSLSIFRPNDILESIQTIDKIQNIVQKIDELYQEGYSLIADTFYEQNTVHSLYALFRPKYKNADKIKKSIILQFTELRTYVTYIEKYNFPIISLEEVGNYESLRELYDSVCTLSNNIPVIQKDLAQYESLQSKLSECEQNIHHLLETGLFKFTFKEHRHFNSIDELLEYYSSIENSIHTLKDNMNQYESFHKWQYFYNTLSENEQIILTAFINITSDKWIDVFKAWYYRTALLFFESNSESKFNRSQDAERKLKQISHILQNLKELQSKYIDDIWNDRRKKAVNNLNLNLKLLYNLRKNKKFNHRNPLKKIIDTDFELFTSFSPVILTNPSVVSGIFPLQPGLFEVVIFDEASQLRIEDTFTSLIRGQYKIIAGDKHQMPPSNYFHSSTESVNDTNDQSNVFTEEEENTILAESESLLQYGENLTSINRSYLDFHYRSDHPALINFSNCAFYGGNLIPFPEKEVYDPIIFQQVNGEYGNHVNPREVEEIIHILQEKIHINNQGNYPSVGIATFNLDQKELIKKKLEELAQNDIDFGRKFQDLKDTGFIKNLENIQGDEKDIIILSTTFGNTRDGKFREQFGKINRQEGYKLLNVLITRAKKKIYVCTSIPRERYTNYYEIISHEGNNKKGILYAYLSYAEAVSNRDYTAVENILNTLKKQSFDVSRATSKSDELTESPFEEEVYEELLKHFSKNNIALQYKIGGFRVDFLIKVSNREVVLECDGKTYHQSDEAHAYDLYRQKELENLGYIIYRIWSTDWFQRPESEMKKFLDFIETL